MMKRYSICLFLAGSLLSLSTSVRAQRALGARSFVLDDGSGHTVTISLPAGLTGSYNWTLPITSSGTALSLPKPTTTGSMLYSNGTSWLENTNIIASAAGDVTANSLSVISGNISTPSIGAFPTELSLTGGTGSTGGASIQITGGNGNFASGAGGNITIIPGVGYQGGTLELCGGAGLGPTSGSISFYTSPPGVGVETYRMSLDALGTLNVGGGNQFKVDNLGNISGASLNSTPIGNTSPSSGAFNYLTDVATIPNGSAALIANLSGGATTTQYGLSLTANGSGSQQNVGLIFSVSGATGGNNYDIQGTGGTPSWSVTSAGAASFTSVNAPGGSTSLGLVTSQTVAYGQETTSVPSNTNTVSFPAVSSVIIIPHGGETGDVTATVTGESIGTDQIMYLENNMGDGHNVILNSVVIPDGAVYQFIFIGGVWKHVQ